MMIRLSVATLAALYCVLYYYGDPDLRSAEVSRMNAPQPSLIQAAALSTAPVPKDAGAAISDREAIEMAMAAGALIRQERMLAKRAAPVSEFSVASKGLDPEPAAYWIVTGNRVNLRRGPGTANAVVGQVTFGTEAEVLSDKDGWYEIRVADGSAAGWIFGKFLKDELPG